MASGYDVPKLAPFIISARRVMPVTEVSIFIFSNNPPASLRRMAAWFAVQLVRFHEPSAILSNVSASDYSLVRLPVVWRFVLFEALLTIRSACTLSWLLVDSRDVIFQEHVFRSAPASWLQDRVVLGLENRALTVRGDDGEPVDVPDSGFLNSSLTGIGGLHLKSLRCLFGERQIQRMRVNRVMINSGALLGSGAAFTSFLSGYVDTLWGVRDRDCRFQERGYRDRARLIKKRTGRIVPPSYWWWIPDQLFLNYMVYGGDSGVEAIETDAINAKVASSSNLTNSATVLLQRNENGGVLYTVGSNTNVGKKLLGTKFIFNVRTPAGNAVASVLHMFDRAPVLNEVVAEYFKKQVAYWNSTNRTVYFNEGMDARIHYK